MYRIKPGNLIESLFRRMENGKTKIKAKARTHLNISKSNFILSEKSIYKSSNPIITPGKRMDGENNAFAIENRLI
jgi:hypothetical protein